MAVQGWQRHWQSLVATAVLLLAAPCLAQVTPSVLVVPDQGGRPQIPGETSPAADRQLVAPGLQVGNNPAPVVPATRPAAPASADPGELGAKKAQSPEPKRQLPWRPQSALQLEVGAALLPNTAMAWWSRYDKHPQLRGTAIDLTYWWPLASDRWLGLRAGLVMPSVAATNWYESAKLPTADPNNNAWRPLYTDIGIHGIDLAVDYIGFVPLHERVAWTYRAGVGLLILPGNATTIETLPSCKVSERPTCAHWPSVGQGTAPVPPVLPSLRATTGFAFAIGGPVWLTLEGGLRDVLWAGGGVSVRF